ncbi:MAG: TRAP transporter small permease [Reyranellaceae bacterium]
MHAPVSSRPTRTAQRLAGFRNARKRLFKGIEAVLFGLVLLLLLLVCLQVTSRYLIQMSLSWTEETARIALLWTVMLGAAVAMERREHYAITVLSDRLRPPVDRMVALAVNLIGIVFLAALCIYGVKYADSGMRSSYVSLGIPRGWIYLALPIGSVLMTVSLVFQSIEMFHAPSRQEGGGAELTGAGPAPQEPFSKI